MIKLLDVVSMTLRPVQKSRLARIDAEDFSPIVRKVIEDFRALGFFHDEDYLERGIFALRQYYAVAILDPANAHAVSAPLDPFWHAHILHTERYIPFCQETAGGYMHHRPLDQNVGEHVKVIQTLYDYTLFILPQIFSRVDEEFWPKNGVLVCSHQNQDYDPGLRECALFPADERMTLYPETRQLAVSH